MPELEIPPIREIVPPTAPDASTAIYWWIGGAILVMLLLLVVLLIFMLRRGKSGPARTHYDPRATSLTKLHELKENYLPMPASEFAVEASHGLREYLTAFYGSMTPYETGVEFLERQNRDGNISLEKFGALKDLYDRAEGLKYAPVPGADSLRLDLIDDMISFVRDDAPGAMLTVANNPIHKNANPATA